MDTEMGKALRDMSRTKVPSNKSKTLGRKRNVQGAKTASAHHKKKRKNQCNVTFGSTVVNQIVFMSLLHMPLGKVCQQGKEISIIKQTEYFFFQTEGEKHTIHCTTPTQKPRPLFKNRQPKSLHRNNIATQVKSKYFMYFQQIFLVKLFLCTQYTHSRLWR